MKSFSVSFLIAGAVFVGTVTGPVWAEPKDDSRHLNHLLRGDYVTTTSRDCVESSAGFDPETLQLRPPTAPPFVLRRTVNSDGGKIHYNGDGTARATFRTLTIEMFTGPGGFPVSHSDSTCDILYTVTADLIVDHALSCTFQAINGTVATSGSVDIPRTLGQLVQEGRMILSVVPEPPVVETVTFNTAGVPSRQRVCTRSTTFVRVSAEQ